MLIIAEWYSCPMPTVYFSHRSEAERAYLRDLQGERAWFERNHFPVYLPDEHGLDSATAEKARAVLRESTQRVRIAWREISGRFFSTQRMLRHARNLDAYRCHVSRFGPEGKYRRPNFVFLRLRTKRDERRAVETVAHELLHLTFADFFERRKLRYAQREGIIDALFVESPLRTLFPRYQVQSAGKRSTAILREILAQ